jgi:hypothetical protein
MPKSKTKKPSVPILPRGKAKKRKPLKKAAPGLGPGPHHGSTYKGNK